MLYFAYGSNMDWSRMRQRCATVQFLFKAMLPEYELQFTRFSRTNRCGAADIIPTPGKNVWGVVYHIEADDRRKLDEKEGVLVGAYRPENTTVQADGDSARRLKIFTYVVCSRETPRPKPNKTYLQHLLDGAEAWKLPAAYIDMLRSVETLPPTEEDAARTLAREIAASVIQENSVLWEELKSQLRAGYDVGVYGSVIHMDFLGAVEKAVTRLSEAERISLKTHIRRPTDAGANWTYRDQINSDIFNRAKRAVARS